MTRTHDTITFLTVLLGSLCLSSCSPWGCEPGSGAVAEERLQLDPFHGVLLEGSMDVLISKGEAQEVVIEGQSNLIGLVGTNVKNGVWTISTSKCYSTNEPFRVHITVPMLDRVIVQGSGSVKGVDEFSLGEVELELQGSGDIDMAIVAGVITAAIQGSGDIRLRGSTGKLIASVEGSGDIRAGELIAGDVDANVVGSGDIKVRTSGNLDAEIAGSGDVEYIGEPTSIDERITGSGDIEQVEE
ncbi:MAG: DUF2807 domain-containing protein [Flavobacteriales bacterium]|nr:DUF2807 domain-containing protein [Flavobacteriales bacterium]